MGNNYENFHVPPDYGANIPFDGMPMRPFHGVEFQPSEVCPKNFIIFDQTDHRSQVMFHPAISHKFTAPSLNEHAAYYERNFQNNDVDREISEQKEDSDDIDALLSSDEYEHGESDNEEVSTGRTFGNYGCDSPDSYSNYDSKPKIGSSSFTADSSKSGTQRKRKKMKKMIKGLRGIVPGGDQMNTADVLDEAVQYLKSLKVEAQKLGVGGNFRN